MNYEILCLNLFKRNLFYNHWYFNILIVKLNLELCDVIINIEKFNIHQ